LLFQVEIRIDHFGIDLKIMHYFEVLYVTVF
jgi:hypothetical protein